MANWERGKRCPVCDWPYAESATDGCVPGNCSYRPPDGSDEAQRIRERREQLKEAGRLPWEDGPARGNDPDVAAAVREQAARECEDLAAEIVDSMELGRGSDDNPRYVGQVVGVRQCADRIRAPGRPAATAAACGRCRGRGTVEQTAATPDHQLIWHGDRALYGTFDCPDCGGTGGATGEEPTR